MGTPIKPIGAVLKQMETIEERPIALVTDTHMGARSNCEHFNTYFLNFFDTLFFPTLKKYRVETVIHLGDLGQYRKQINTRILTSWRERVFEPLTEYQCFFIVGNHDCYFKTNNKINLQQSLSLNKHYGFTVVDQEMISLPEFSIDLLPWCSPEEVKNFLFQVDQSSSRFLMGHLEFSHPETPFQETQIEPDRLNKYTQVFSGHFHKKLDFSPSIHYIGNPYPITWADYNEPRGMTLFYPNQNKFVQIKNPHSIFKKISFQTILNQTSLIVPEEFTQKHIMVLIKSEHPRDLLDMFIQSLEKMNVLSITLQKEDSLIESQTISEHFESKDTLSYINLYIKELFKQKEFHLDEKTVLNYFSSIYTKSQSLEL